jgi:plasmid stabilization system protein ParE
MEVRWSLPAAEDLERICAWIEHDNPEAARRAAKTIYDGCGRLKDFPNMGRRCVSTTLRHSFEEFSEYGRLSLLVC